MNTCHGCDSALPEGATYCPRCGLAAGAAAPQLPAWRLEPARPAAPPNADVWAGPPDAPVAGKAEVLTAQTPGPDRRRRILIAAVTLLVLVVGAIVGVGQFGGGKSASSPTQAPSAPINSLPAQVQGTGVSPIFPGQNDLVTVAPGVDDSPALASTVELLTRYFTAINSHHDYAGWVRTLVPRPGRATPAEYAGFRTTIDSDVVIHGIAVDQKSNLRVDVAFVSHQSPRLGSLHDCLSWEIAYSMVPSPVYGLRIDLVSNETISDLPC